MMTSDQLRNVILEAVDCLRQRKCRPDRESIAVFVMRKLGSSMSEIFNEIENIVDQGALLKVEYKGSTSYRSPKSFGNKSDNTVGFRFLPISINENYNLLYVKYLWTGHANNLWDFFYRS